MRTEIICKRWKLWVTGPGFKHIQDPEWHLLPDMSWIQGQACKLHQRQNPTLFFGYKGRDFVCDRMLLRGKQFITIFSCSLFLGLRTFDWSLSDGFLFATATTCQYWIWILKSSTQNRHAPGSLVIGFWQTFSKLIGDPCFLWCKTPGHDAMIFRMVLVWNSDSRLSFCVMLSVEIVLRAANTLLCSR